MTTAAKKSYGTLFKQGSTTIAEVTNIGEVGPECEAIDVTNFDSPSGWREFISGLKTGGTVAITMNFVGGSSQTGLQTALGGAAQTFSVVFTDALQTFSFSALVTKFKGIPNGPDAALTASVEFQLTGAITIS